MLGFFQSYTEMKEKAEEEKIKLLRGMQQTKNISFLSISGCPEKR